MNKILILPLLFLCSCKHLAMDSLVHSETPISNKVTINFGKELKEVIQKEAQEEIRNMKRIHDLEHQKMYAGHRSLEEKIKTIHEQAERDAQQKYKKMELSIDKLIALYENIQKSEKPAT